MGKHNPNNERIKRKYLVYLKEAQRYSEASIDVTAKALDRFEQYTGHKDFKVFHHEQALGFKKHLAKQKNTQTGKPLSTATLHVTLSQLKKFFHWLAGQPGYKSRFQYSDSDYFNLSRKDVRVAAAHRSQPVPTLEQVRHVIFSMPAETEIERRNRALIAFILLTGARDRAVASFKLKHVDLHAGCVYQDAREVQTKFSKTFTSYFFPVGDDVRVIVEEWVRWLRTDMLWGNDDPLFPATHVAPGPSQKFEPVGLKRQHWSSAGSIRKIFRMAFEAAGLPYFNPHSLRHTLVRLATRVCVPPEEFKAWSQSLGHESVLTTFCSYGTVSETRQAEIMHKLANSGPLERRR